MKYNELTKPQDMDVFNLLETIADITADGGDLKHCARWLLNDISFDGAQLANMTEGDVAFWFVRRAGTCFVYPSNMQIYVNEYHPPQVLRVECTGRNVFDEGCYNVVMMDTADALTECGQGVPA